MKQLVLRSGVGQSNISFGIKGKDADPLVLSGALLAESLLVWVADAGQGDAPQDSCMWAAQ